MSDDDSDAESVESWTPESLEAAFPRAELEQFRLRMRTKCTGPNGIDPGKLLRGGRWPKESDNETYKAISDEELETQLQRHYSDYVGTQDRFDAFWEYLKQTSEDDHGADPHEVTYMELHDFVSHRSAKKVLRKKSMASSTMMQHYDGFSSTFRPDNNRAGGAFVQDTESRRVGKTPRSVQILYEQFSNSIDEVSWSQKKLKAFFKQVDADGSGHVDPEEFRKMLEDRGIPVSDADFELLLCELDTDDSNTIDYEEFIKRVHQKPSQDALDRREEKRRARAAARKAARAEETANVFVSFKKVIDSASYSPDSMKKLFKKFDADGSGSISRKEFKGVLKSLGMESVDPQQLDQLVAMLDVNNNEQIDYDEFVKEALQLGDAPTEEAKASAEERAQRRARGELDEEESDAEDPTELLPADRLEQLRLRMKQKCKNIKGDIDPGRILRNGRWPKDRDGDYRPVTQQKLKANMRVHFNNYVGTEDTFRGFWLYLRTDDDKVVCWHEMDRFLSYTPRRRVVRQKSVMVSSAEHMKNFSSTFRPDNNSSKEGAFVHDVESRAKGRVQNRTKLLYQKFHKALLKADWSEEGMVELFKSFDTDDSGHVDREEFRKIFKDQDLKITDRDIDLLILELDVDESGTIDYKEFITNAVNFEHGPTAAAREKLQARELAAKAAARAAKEKECAGVFYAFRRAYEDASFSQQGMKSMFRKFDKDKSGTISRSEFKQVFKSMKVKVMRKQLNALMDILDIDGDDSINYEEFLLQASKVDLAALEGKRSVSSPEQSNAQDPAPVAGESKTSPAAVSSAAAPVQSTTASPPTAGTVISGPKPDADAAGAAAQTGADTVACPDVPDGEGLAKEAIDSLRQRLKVKATTHKGLQVSHIFNRRKWPVAAGGPLPYTVLQDIFCAMFPKEFEPEFAFPSFWLSLNTASRAVVTMSELSKFISAAPTPKRVSILELAAREAKAGKMNLKVAVAGKRLLNRKFARKIGDNVLDDDELKMIKNKIRAASYKRGGSDLKKLFSEWDKDNSQTLDYDELAQALARILPAKSMLSKQEMAQLCKRFDVNGDGAIDVTEFSEFLKVETRKGRYRKSRHELEQNEYISHKSLVNSFTGMFRGSKLTKAAKKLKTREKKKNALWRKHAATKKPSPVKTAMESETKDPATDDEEEDSVPPPASEAGANTSQASATSADAGAQSRGLAQIELGSSSEPATLPPTGVVVEPVRQIHTPLPVKVSPSIHADWFVDVDSDDEAEQDGALAAASPLLKHRRQTAARHQPDFQMSWNQLEVESSMPISSSQPRSTSFPRALTPTRLRNSKWFPEIDDAGAGSLHRTAEKQNIEIILRERAWDESVAGDGSIGNPWKVAVRTSWTGEISTASWPTAQGTWVFVPNPPSQPQSSVGGSPRSDRTAVGDSLTASTTKYHARNRLGQQPPHGGGSGQTMTHPIPRPPPIGISL